MEDKKLTYTDFINMVRDDMKAKNADRATRKNLYVIAKNKYEDYLKGENNKIEEKKYVNEEGQFDFKKFVADGALEKNLNEVGGFHDPRIGSGRDENTLAEGLVSPKRGHEFFQLTKDTPIRYIKGKQGMGLEVPGVLIKNLDGYIDGKKGAYLIDYFGAVYYVDLKKKFASPIYPMKDQPKLSWKTNFIDVDKAPQMSDWKKYLNEIGMFNDPIGYDSGAAAEDKRAIAAIKDLIEKGVPRDEAIQKVADEFGLRFHYLAKRVNEVKNKDRYIEKHGPIFKVDNEEKIDFLQGITDPSGYGYEEEDYDREDALYDEAEALGTLPQLKRMLGITHWGREGGLSRYDPRNRRDPLGYRNQKKTYRFKKDGDMYSVDKASMKSTAAWKLKDLKKQSQVMKDKGRQLPEFTLKEIDEMLKESRSKDNK